MFRIGTQDCPYCSDTNIYRSRRKNLWEVIAFLFLLRPVRCHGCMHRFFRPVLIDTPERRLKQKDTVIPEKPGS